MSKEAAVLTRPAPPGGSLGGRRSMPRLPYLVSRVFFLGAAILVVRALLPGLSWWDWVVDVFSTVFIPIDGSSVGAAVFLLILGAALARRKRAGWVIAVGIVAVVVAADLLTVLGSIVLVANGRLDFPDLPTFARFAANLAAAGASLAVLVVHRGEFTARRPPGSARLALLILAAGTALSVGVGWGLVTVFPGQLSGPRGRLSWIVSRLGSSLYGQDAPDVLHPPLTSPPSWVSTFVGLLFGLTLFAALIALMRSQQRAALMSAEDEPRVRALVARSPEDSLAYFATRRDKSVVFSASGQAAITYRVDLGVCLASSDPIGPVDHWPGAIRAWQRLVDTYGWTPAVLGASEQGATAYAQAGLRVLGLGDEAILHVGEFSLESRPMRGVRQSVERLEKLGYRVRIRRHRDISSEEMAELVAKVAAWRDTESERGFSMALGRIADPADGDCLMVEAVFPPGRCSAGPSGDVAGVLSFVPWGRDGYSLDVMRRSPAADNGVTELMVSALMAAGRDLGLRQISLNFAVFRAAFEEGARIGAGPVLRLWRRLLLVASRWWQIESLFRSNVKYQPDWRPRFLCYAETRDIALVGAASGVAEGFIDLPAFLRPHRPEVRARGGLMLDAASPGLHALPAAPEAAAPVATPAEPRRPQQQQQRLELREQLLADGVDPYPPSFRPTSACAAVEVGSTARVAGRVTAVRDLGGVLFVVLRDGSGTAQLLLERSGCGAASMQRLRRTVDLGDHVGAAGTGVRSRSGELSLAVTDWLLTSKAVRTSPDPRHGITDPETRVRQRYLDLMVNPAARDKLAARSRAVQAVRDCLRTRDFLEVETPILQTVHGGANARPFTTHINAYDLPLYLRIAPELYLKRLMVGGMDRVFEIGRNFRNEGADATHNPEFTMLEAYEAYGDYTTMATVAQSLITAAAHAVTGGSVVTGGDADGRRHEVDLSEPWPVVTVHDAISGAAGEQISADTPVEVLRALAGRLGITCNAGWSRGAVVLELYEHLVEDRTVRPTFYTDFPADVSPLTRPHRDDDRLAERWDLVAFGAEIGTAYSELVDPVEQRARLTAQSLQAAGGDPEAMQIDEDFLTALEYAMPPTGGLGLGIDRLVMMLTSSSIRDTIAFPLVKPRRSR